MHNVRTWSGWQCGEGRQKVQLWLAHNQGTTVALHQKVYKHLQGLLLPMSYSDKYWSLVSDKNENLFETDLRLVITTEVPAISRGWRCVHLCNIQDSDVQHEMMQRPSIP